MGREEECAVRWIGLSVCLLSAIGYAYTGSTPAMLAYLRGQQIVLDRTTAQLEAVEFGTDHDAPFTLQNLTRQPIRIVGLKATCPCVVPKDYPRTIPARSRVVVPVKYHPKAQGGPFREEITLMTDASAQPILRLTVTGTAIPQPPPVGPPTDDQLEPIPTTSEPKGSSRG